MRITKNNNAYNTDEKVENLVRSPNKIALQAMTFH